MIVNGQNGFVHTDKAQIVDVMRQLIDEPELARRWGEAGRQTAMQRFNMDRYIADWMAVIAEVTGGASAMAPEPALASDASGAGIKAHTAEDRPGWPS